MYLASHIQNHILNHSSKALPSGFAFQLCSWYHQLSNLHLGLKHQICSSSSYNLSILPTVSTLSLKIPLLPHSNPFYTWPGSHSPKHTTLIISLAWAKSLWGYIVSPEHCQKSFTQCVSYFHIWTKSAISAVFLQQDQPEANTETQCVLLYLLENKEPGSESLLFPLKLSMMGKLLSFVKKPLSSYLVIG